MYRVTPVVAVAHGAGCPALAAVVELPLRHPMGNTWAMMRGGAVGQLACLISTRSQVRILPHAITGIVAILPKVTRVSGVW